jgi:hypothetical protein
MISFKGQPKVLSLFFLPLFELHHLRVLSNHGLSLTWQLNPAALPSILPYP